jgi:outer membrane murein-binding lipoprotein Lpp
MKKITTLLMAAALVTTLGLSGCKKKKTDEAAAPAKTEEPKPAEPAPAAPAAPAAGSAATPEAAPAGEIKTGVPECDEYIKLAEKYFACDKVAKDDPNRAGFADMKKMWAAGIPDSAKQASTDSCKASIKSTTESAKALGCTL